MVINLLILTISIIFIWNHSGFMYELNKGLYKTLNPNKIYMGQTMKKPVSCSNCMVFWTTFIYSLFSLNLIYSLGISVGFMILSIFIDKLLMILIRLINKIK